MEQFAEKIERGSIVKIVDGVVTSRKGECKIFVNEKHGTVDLLTAESVANKSEERYFYSLKRVYSDTAVSVSNLRLANCRKPRHISPHLDPLNLVQPLEVKSPSKTTPSHPPYM
jgi:hypothetical protein